MHTYTIKDVSQLLGERKRSRVQQQWTKLPPFADRPTHERSARRFTRADLLTFVVFDVLEERFFVKVHSLGRISRGVHEFLQQPWSAHADGRVLLDLENGQVAPFSESDARQGFLVDLTPIRERVDVFLGLVPEQREIPLSVGASGGD